MKNIEKILLGMKKDLYENHKSNNCIQFLQSTTLHYSICLEIGIGHFSNEHISFEKLCESIPKKFGSRSSIQTILNHGVSQKFFVKEISKEDKRIKIYKYSDYFANSLNKWLEYNAEIAINIKNAA
tara:strand:+ start:175 stop:552 length:378 start_codon:yes stop_codon:yes gene_type:complete